MKTMMVMIIMIIMMIGKETRRIEGYECPTPIKAMRGYRYEEADACIEGVAWKKGAYEQTITNIQKVYHSLYVYRDINKKSGGDYDIKVDGLKYLKEIKGKSFNTDYEAQKAIQKLFIELKDAHTHYAPPKSYTAWTFMIPIKIKVTKNSGQKLIINGKAAGPQTAAYKLYRETYGEEKTNIVNTIHEYDIEKIEGEDAVEHIKRYAKEKNSYSRDEDVRFNGMIKGTFMQRNLGRSEKPTKATMTMQLKHKETKEQKSVEVPWMAVSMIDMKNMDAAYMKRTLFSQKKWTTSTEAQLKAIQQEVLEGIEDKKEKRHQMHVAFHTMMDAMEIMPNMHLHMVLDTLLKPMMEEVKEEEEEESDYTILYENKDKDFIVRQYKKEPTKGILIVNTFMPKIDIVDPTKNNDMEQLKALGDYMTHMEEAIRALKDIQFLTVDVRGNTGGVVCYGYLLAYYLSPHIPRDATPRGDLRASKLLQQRYCSANMLDKLQMAMANTESELEDDWIQGPTMVRGETSSMYSKPVMIACGTAMTMTFSNFTFSPPRRFSPHNLVILTDGTCGSTCGQFIKLMQQLKAAKIVNQGLKKDMAVASFKGAAVMLLDTVVSSLSLGAQFCQMNSDLIPSSFQTSAMLTFAWFELYPWTNQMHANDRRLVNVATPIGYTKQGADFHLESWDFEGTDVYDELMKHPLWNTCVPEVTYERLEKSCSSPVVPTSVIGGIADIEETTYDDSIATYGEFGYPCESNTCTLYGCGLNRYLSAIDTPKDPNNPNTLYSRHYACLRQSNPFDPYAPIIQQVVYIVGIIGIVSIFVVGSTVLCCCYFISCCTKLAVKSKMAYMNISDEQPPQQEDEEA